MRRLDRGTLVKLYYTEQMSLNEIGKLYDVTRERVRQWMEKEKLIRRKTGGRKPKFNSPGEYFNYVQKTGKESYWTLRRFLHSRNNCCEQCGSKTNLHEHHLKYPATSFRDVQLLCASCHIAEHKKGNGNRKQLQICEKYKKGRNGFELAKEYNVHWSLIYHILHKWNVKTRPIFGRVILSPEERKKRRREYAKRYYQEHKEEKKIYDRQRRWNKKLALVN
ncbi:hypothetical protein ES703_47292 [subsurface metagenome]